MENKEVIKELFISPQRSFDQHLELDENFRILFSGSFGIGKTTFLKHYFEENKDKYNCFHLFPVNYSVAENEDVFKYIKYDLLLELFANHSPPSSSQALFSGTDEFVSENFDKMISAGLLLVPGLGKQLSQFVTKFKDLRNQYIKYKNKNKTAVHDVIHSFLRELHLNDGSLYESNFITLILQNWLKDVKGSKENVLVIDDFDRIDPSHIFRLLNIFSSHFDSKDAKEKNNKFGFDKIIIVCDIENIKSIYQSQFGVETDFNGYVDKFFSKEVFNFDNKEHVESIVESFVDNLYICYADNSEPSGFFKYDRISSSHYDLRFLLVLMIQNGVINLRSLIKLSKQKFDISTAAFFIRNTKVMVKSNNMLTIFWVLSKIVGNLDLLKRIISKMKRLNNIDSKNTYFKEILGNLVLFADAQNMRFDGNNNVLEKSGCRYDLTEEFFMRYSIQTKGHPNKFWGNVNDLLSGSRTSTKSYIEDENYIFNKNWIDLLKLAITNIEE